MEPPIRRYASAVEIRAHLSHLLRERVEANACGLGACDAYMADLAVEIAECRVELDRDRSDQGGLCKLQQSRVEAVGGVAGAGVSVLVTGMERSS